MVRHATFDDIDQLIAIFEKANRESDNYDQFDGDVARRSMEVRILNPYSLVLITDRGDGALVASVSDSIYSRQLQVVNEFLYAESEGAALVRRFRQWGEAWPNARISIWTSYGGAMGERAERLFARLGFEKMGNQYKVK